ncbi:AzlD domain-containing protein [Liquorilactobacillus mali]|uniref:AzlD domain-containing protein n=1 Tax=Liquorilactobacillus mali TaxID=1618 RepID=UPI00024927AA|nr:AzlD domain-containing protein [Liquorilactobacillus mali]MDC7952899.1 AzlD domain-containing protein [Liquorilactobacillus mali]MDV7758275.1 AzlD domain-containing protein [Liquorilactobacillus mali]QFQ75367.1 AzlD domain-containing protein [Liquorilactobacillus mali]
MYSFNYVFTIIISSGFVVWLSKVFPLVILKKYKLNEKAVSFLSFVPITIMSALWFESLFVQHLGQLPGLDIENLVASVPTILSAILTRSLLVIVVVGIISLALIRVIGI